MNNKRPHPEVPDPPVLSFEAWAARVASRRGPGSSGYFAMYASLWEAVVTDPAAMLLPIDDHMVHRGDGAFETFKCGDGALYNVRAHLKRLRDGLERMAIHPPWSLEAMIERSARTVRAGGQTDALVRLFVSRGPGSLGISPYDCPEPALYIIAGKLMPPFMLAHPEGATAQRSAVPVKTGDFARLKSVNYLPNVLMKKEAVDQGVDFVFSFDERGHLAESATENVGLVDRGGVLRIPRPERILPGTTMLRVLELARERVGQNGLRGVEASDLPPEALCDAAEVLVFGTTPNVASVVRFEGRAIGDGRPGPIGRMLDAALADDIRTNAGLRTPCFDRPS